MSLVVDAVQKASQQRETGKTSPRKSPALFLTALAFFLVMGACLAGLYFYEESRISELQNRLAAAIAPLGRLRSENTALLNSKMALENQVKALDEENKEKINELRGRTKVLQYEKETLEFDIAAKEKKIEEMGEQIQKQDQKEEQLMTLIEHAKKQLAAQSAEAAARSAAAAAQSYLPSASAPENRPTVPSTPGSSAPVVLPSSDWKYHTDQAQ